MAGSAAAEQHELVDLIRKNAATSTLYRKLDHGSKEIRTLLLKSGTADAPVFCELQYARLNDASSLPYETISYTWGDSAIRGQLSVDGISLDVPASAQTVLKSLRKPDQDLPVWIDAICINQRDVEERSQQVAMMPDIYANGTRNRVCLGQPLRHRDGDATYLALQLVLAHAKQGTRDFDNFLTTVIDTSTGWYKFACRADGRLDAMINFEALLKVYACAWFTRLWVVQEAALAKTSICHYGEYDIPLMELLKVAAWLSYDRHMLPFEFMNHVGLRNASRLWEYVDFEQGPYRSDQYASSLSRCIGNLQHFECQEPKDRLYALLGLYLKLAFGSWNEIPPLLRPDYQQTLARVLRNAAIYTLFEEDDLSLFDTLGLQNEEIATSERMPSWVPQWHRVKENEQLAQVLRSSFHCCGENITSSIRRRWRSGKWTNLDVLTVHGIHIDAVARVWPHADPRTDSKAFLQIVREAVSVLRDTGQSEKHALEILALTLIAETDHHRQAISPKQALESFKAWRSYLETKKEIPPSLPYINNNTLKRLFSSSASTLASQYHQPVFQNMNRRCLFLTQSGRLGAGPLTMQESDEIMAVWGCRWPVILRRDPEIRDYRVVGISYLHGTMQGEDVAAHEAEGGGEEVFWLR